MRDTNLVNALREHAEWVRANEWETPITLGDDLTEAADRIANQSTHIAVLQKEIEKLRGQLKAYEDTGRTPEEVSALVKDWSDLRTIIGECGGLDRVRALVKADKDGRLAVLPCKVGDTLWVTGRDNVPREMELEAPDIRAVCTDEDNLCMSTCNRKPDGFCAYRLRNDGADIGKTVFLTHEQAERALEAMKNGNC